MASEATSSPNGEEKDTCPQFVGDGPKVFVRNTFLDCDFGDDAEAPAPGGLVRARTAPPKVGPGDDRDDDEDEGAPTEMTEETETCTDLPPDFDDGDLDDPSLAPPPPTSVVRLQTHDGWEDARNWTWATSVHTTSVAVPPSPWPAASPAPAGTAIFVPAFVMPVAPGPSPSQPWPGQGGESVSSAGTPQTDLMPPAPVPAATGSAGAADASADRAAPAPPPQPQTLKRWQSCTTGYNRILWTVDARKLKNNDKQAVSPPFTVAFSDPSLTDITFKMMLYPKSNPLDQKGGCSFKKAKGKGFVQLKCEAELDTASSAATLSFRIGVGAPGSPNAQPMRGPVMHNFSQSAVCGLPKEEEEWDFNEVVDPGSMTFVVNLAIAVSIGVA
mmetsp:Transcript_67371/g.161561  ORF Transcript_67371/g.161561 Transcript_67371/m.161561 type:complete len:386 (+) Transcript_67371:87-1244(+)